MSAWATILIDMLWRLWIWWVSRYDKYRNRPPNPGGAGGGGGPGAFFGFGHRFEVAAGPAGNLAEDLVSCNGQAVFCGVFFGINPIDDDGDISFRHMRVAMATALGIFENLLVCFPAFPDWHIKL